MSNQRVVVLIDEEIEALQSFFSPEGRAQVEVLRRVREKLRAALEHPEGITEWRWFAGDMGGSNDCGEPRRSCREAEADLASVVAETDPPFDRLGIESRQCGPWVEVSRTIDQVNR